MNILLPGPLVEPTLWSNKPMYSHHHSHFLLVGRKLDFRKIIYKKTQILANCITLTFYWWVGKLFELKRLYTKNTNTCKLHHSHFYSKWYLTYDWFGKQFTFIPIWSRPVCKYLCLFVIVFSYLYFCFAGHLESLQGGGEPDLDWEVGNMEQASSLRNHCHLCLFSHNLWLKIRCLYFR